ncbi:hypothetical protein EQH57_0007 [Dictyocoela roeselum]|nr:hypothetical protein EQH57_0007 [Dictyocoela roeselum]
MRGVLFVTPLALYGIVQGIINVDMFMILNEYFVTVFTNENMDNIPEVEPPGEVQPLENIHFLISEVEEQLCKLNIFKSTEPDDLPPRILRSLSEIISSPLTEVFNRSVTTGIILENWKTANISAIFKKGSRQES